VPDDSLARISCTSYRAVPKTERCVPSFAGLRNTVGGRGITPALLRVGQLISKLMHPVSSTSRGYQHAATLTPGDSSAIPCPTILWPDDDDPGDSLASVFTAIGKVSHGHG
jgi:hypothetical protein